MLDRITDTQDIPALMADMGARARAAAAPLAVASDERKHAALTAMAEAIIAATDDILAANAIDMENARQAGISGSFLDRLNLTKDRVRAMADGMLAIAALKDPVGDVIAAWERPNGLKIERVRTPLGVIGVIYESRPNVTA
ncbi:MAG: gamma-glutamyl-phosphate reductase, partial [Ahrensia sp.]